jgi:hypothetical protein
MSLRRRDPPCLQAALFENRAKLPRFKLKRREVRRIEGKLKARNAGIPGDWALLLSFLSPQMIIRRNVLPGAAPWQHRGKSLADRRPRAPGSPHFTLDAPLPLFLPMAERD